MSYGSVMEPKDRSSSKDQTLLEDDLFKGFSYVSEDFINTPRGISPFYSIIFVAEEDPNLDLYLEQLKQEREDLIKQQEEKKKQAMKKLKKNKKKQQNHNKKKQNNKNEAKQEQESSQELLFTTSPIEPVAETSEDCLLTKAIHQSSSKWLFYEILSFFTMSLLSQSFSILSLFSSLFLCYFSSYPPYKCKDPCFVLSIRFYRINLWRAVFSFIFHKDCTVILI